MGGGEGGYGGADRGLGGGGPGGVANVSPQKIFGAEREELGGGAAGGGESGAVEAIQDMGLDDVGMDGGDGGGAAVIVIGGGGTHGWCMKNKFRFVKSVCGSFLFLRRKSVWELNG